MQNERLDIGVVCGQCDHWSPLGTSACPECMNELTLFVPRRTSTPPPPRETPKPPAVTPTIAPAGPAAGSTSGSTAGSTAGSTVATPVAGPVTGVTRPGPAPSPGRPKQETPPAVRPGRSGSYSFAATQSGFADLSQEELMEQARNYVCRSCSSGVPMGHKFCGRCGSGVPPEILNAQTLFFGDMQNPAKAKLILIRGEGMDGLSFHLKAEQHVVGRNEQLVIPDDPFVSPKHANFFYRDGKLVVRDEGSLNGVYIRVRGTVDIAAGDTFLAGEQLSRLDPMPRA